jgi:group I intron endonuclease
MNTTAQLETVNANVKKIHGLDNQQPMLYNVKVYSIYKITNTITGMSYIGFTTRRICDRWEEHVANSRGRRKRKSKLYVAIAKYGSKAFVRTCLATVYREDEAKKLEAKYIKQFNTCDNGYNSNLGGCGFRDVPKDMGQRIKEGKRKAQERRENPEKFKDEKPPIKKEFWETGAKNPLAKTYLVRFPNGEEHIVTGLKKFCREHNIHAGDMSYSGKSKGYVVMARFIDYPSGEYTQAGGNGEGPSPHNEGS